MPADDRLRFDDHQGVQNARRNPIEAGKNEAIEVAEGESLRGFSSEHVELVAQRQDLGLEIHGEVDSDRRSGRVRLRSPTLETTMQTVADRPEAPNAIRNDLGAIFVSLSLSRSPWLITSLSPSGGEKRT